MFEVKLRCSALVAIAAVVAFGAAPVFAQTMVTDAQPASTAGRAGPLNVVTSSVSRVLTMARAAQPSDAAESGKRRAEIRQAAEELFDFDEMSRRLLGQSWMDASPQQQHDFTVLLADLLQSVYLKTLGNFTSAKISFQGETITGSYAQVRSKMATGSGEIAIEYRMLERDGQWAVYDVAVDGVSLVSNYRSQFNSILKRISFAQLLEHLKNREAAAVPRGDQGQ